jgi:peptidylprolyl isomerase
MAFTLGSGQVIPGFDEAVDGMGVGDSKTITISSADAYGPYREDMVLNVPKEQLPEGLDPQVGQQLQMGQGEENMLIVSIIEVADESITLDANHPLAGKDLTFDIELVAIG